MASMQSMESELERVAHTAAVEQRFISHEWEELLHKLVMHGDPKLRALGMLELEALKREESKHC